MQAEKKPTTTRHQRLASDPDREGPSRLPFTSATGQARALALVRAALAPSVMPSDTSPEQTEMFMRCLESMRFNRDPGRVARAAARKKLLSQLEAAFNLLHKHLPPLLPDFQPRDVLFEFLPTQTSRERDRLKSEALKGLVAALDAAESSALLPLDRVEETPPRWRDYAARVVWIFQDYMPQASKGAQYRFVAAVVPMLSGEHPTHEAVASHFKKGRSIKRGKSKRDLS